MRSRRFYLLKSSYGWVYTATGFVAELYITHKVGKEIGKQFLKTLTVNGFIVWLLLQRQYLLES